MTDRDYQQFPDDDNGDVLWQMHQDGDDLTEAHEIEYSIAFTSQEQAEKCALFLLHEEQKISLFVDEESDLKEWIITIYMYMEPEYSDIVDLEEWVTKIAEQYQGVYDGWGCMAYVYDDEIEDDESPASLNS
ncbi:ribonuclease E inhibitor RraB [Acinetobacter shaoyimingii]|uniref:Ribonuclease E inhibitor RraB n=1 Tax=Acinetobacter shaoyimingii TaxID=2715164 RepID=A0A6G8RY35_9GAMM|nr:ribonuclease E inhibitor RraB [Acinetobacter shaoyimingii]NHB58650.1 ribonuclease E inhibitor RraB [Acinetobacter shaoyimingii]QIO06781.1 ribonuclease E inhibitor RraB [Acinetobacter shaoyimingii]